jgi:SAM-dependent methyltransferase
VRFQRSFDWVARPYETAERWVFGKALEQTRRAHLDALATCRRVLILGEGDGRFLSWLLQANPGCEVDVVDGSRRMLELARARTALDSKRVRFMYRRIGDSRSIDTRPPYDLLVTQFFLDCFEEPELTNVVTELTELCGPDAVWLYADFHPGRTWMQRLRSRLWLWILYRVFRALTEIRAGRWVDPIPALRARGWATVARQTFEAELLESRLLARGPHGSPSVDAADQ